MFNKIIITIILILISISCSDKKSYTEYVKDGVRIVENSKNGLLKEKSFNYKIEEIYAIQNSEEDSSFILNFPGDRANLNADLDDDLNLYVVDNIRRLILKFDNTGKFIKSFGGKGQGPGEFALGPVDICVDSKQNKLFVFDMTGRLSIFTLDGEFIEFKKVSKRNIRPKGFKMTNNGALFLCETYEGRFGEKDFKMGNFLFNSSGKETLDINKKIFGTLKPFDIKKIDSEDQDLIMTISSNNEDILIANSSKNDYIINSFDYTGKKNFVIKKKYNAVRRSKESMSAIKESLDKYTKKTGGMVEFQKVSEMKSVIGQMFSDEKSNLWVSVNESLFDPDGQEFDVFRFGGHFLKTAKVKDLAGYRIRSKKGYLIATTPIETNYLEDGKADPVIKIFRLSMEK